MADIIVTATSVVPSSGVAYETRQAGAAITAGQSIYADSNGVWQLADANASSTTAGVGSQRIAVSMSGGALNQYITGAYDGIVNLGATLVKGTTYYFSANAGGIAPAGDLASGHFVTRVGVATTTALMDLDLLATGIQI